MAMAREILEKVSTKYVVSLYGLRNGERQRAIIGKARLGAVAQPAAFASGTKNAFVLGPQRTSEDRLEAKAMPLMRDCAGSRRARLSAPCECVTYAKNERCDITTGGHMPVAHPSQNWGVVFLHLCSGSYAFSRLTGWDTVLKGQDHGFRLET